jgi:hypothetical protein
MSVLSDGNDFLNKKKFKEQLHQFLENAAHEIAETKEAGIIIIKHHVHGEKLTKEEKKFIKTQTYDVLKSIGIVVPFALIPGASVIIPIIVAVAKKRGVEILPSSFQNSVTKTEKDRLNKKTDDNE